MKKMAKDALDLTKTNIILGVGGTVVGNVGGNAAGLQALGNYQGTIGSIMGAGLTLKSMKKLRL